MRILHINDHLAAVGGVETYLLGLVPKLEDAGHQILVGHGRGDSGLVSRAEPMRLLTSTRHRDVGSGRREAAALIERFRPDVVHLHGIQNLGVIQAAAASGRAVLHGHDFRPICPAANFFFKRTRQICSRVASPACFGVTLAKHCMTPRPIPAAYAMRRVQWVVRHANRFARVVAPSEHARRRFLAAGFAAARVVTQPYFCPIPVRSIPRTPPVEATVTFLGRASYNKGWDVFIRALGRLPRFVRGLMVGSFSAKSREEIAQISSAAGCADRLRVEGWAGRDAIGNIMANTTALAFPSLWPETLGIVGLEAMANGVPVVASAVGGVEEWLENGRNGLLVSPDDPAALADGLLQIVSDSRLQVAMGERGITKMNERFSVEDHVRNLVRIYEGVAIH